MRQPSGRYELVAGRSSPWRLNARFTTLRRSRSFGLCRMLSRQLPCPALSMATGMTVIIDEDNSREPDALVQCGKPIERRATSANVPLVLVEVVSPSSGHTDNVDKLIEYFSVPTVRHYLIVNPELEVVIH